jgi:hypothetical protein
MAIMLNRSPLAVLRPFSTLPYQVAIPLSALNARTGFFAGAVTILDSTFAGAVGGRVTAGRASGVYACTVNVESAKKTAATERDINAPVTQNHADRLSFRVRDFCRSTIRPFY